MVNIGGKGLQFKYIYIYYYIIYIYVRYLRTVHYIITICILCIQPPNTGPIDQAAKLLSEILEFAEFVNSYWIITPAFHWGFLPLTTQLIPYLMFHPVSTQVNQFHNLSYHISILQ